jgi:uncharacterized protein (UPF0276 family)
VWKLFEIIVARRGPIPTLIEWDSNIPAWPVLKSEALAARAILHRDAPALAIVPGDHHAVL